MDLHLTAARASAEERAAVDALLGPEPADAIEGRFSRAGHSAREQRTLLLPALHALQGRIGWISEGGLNYVCERLTVPPAEAYGVATFYAMFSVEPRPATVVHVCDDLACRIERGGGGDAAGSRRRSALRVRRGSGARASGMCEQAPAALRAASERRSIDVHADFAVHADASVSRCARP